MSPPAHPRFAWAALLGGIAALGLIAGSAHAQDRRARATPGIVLNTNGRHAVCDMLLFSPKGGELLAVGDDKVVHVWDVHGNRLIQPSRVLRWPTYREQRGAIFAVAMSPANPMHVAVCGYGLRAGDVAVLDRNSNQVYLGMQEVPDPAVVNWSVTWSPDGRYVVYGNEIGQVFRWDVEKKAKKPQVFAPARLSRGNRVRLVAFTGSRQFIAVTRGYTARDGKVVHGQILQYDVTDPEARPKVLGELLSTEIYRAVLSPERRWLAVTGEFAGMRPDSLQRPWEDRIELIDLHALRDGTPLARCRRIFPLPPPGVRGQKFVAKTLAFNPSSTLLAVGSDERPRAEKEEGAFEQVTTGRVHLFRVATGRLVDGFNLDIGGRPEALAFQPGRSGRPDRLAVAGGDNHEVRLFDVSAGTLLDTVRGEGAVPWAVRLDAEGKYLGWQEQRQRDPTNPNDRGKGAWRVFDLKEGKLLRRAPGGFVPARVLNKVDGWSVEPVSPRLWRVRGPRGTSVELKGELYPQSVNQIPFCYTFVRARGKKPVRLIVGHQWGATVYDCRPGAVTLARALTGHEGPVTSVAASDDGKLAVTASRDQTIACWSLVDWPDGVHPELGARFRTSRGGRPEVLDVKPGSPAWEAGLSDGTELDFVAIFEPLAERGPYYDPQQWFKRSAAVTGKMLIDFLKDGQRMRALFEPAPRCDTDAIVRRLNATLPRRTHLFGWTDGRGNRRFEATTIQQRPLWRLFATRENLGNDWVLWRWRDYFFDSSSPVAEQLVGWHVNGEGVSDTPRFHPLEHFKGSGLGDRDSRLGFHQPDKLWRYVRDQTFEAPATALFADVEPPAVRVERLAGPTPKADMRLKVTITPRSNPARNKMQAIDKVTIWLNDFRYEGKDKGSVALRKLETKAGGVLEQEVTIPSAQMRLNRNEVRVQAYNARGGRGEDRVSFNYADPARKAADRGLHALAAGVTDYDKVKNSTGGTPKDLRLACAAGDARALAAVLADQEGSVLYQGAKPVVKTLVNDQVTVPAIVRELQAVATRVKPDDLFVLFLAGHGVADSDVVRKDSKLDLTYRPGSFYYLCSDTDFRDDSTKLTSTQLTNLLATINCRKLILLDACHSGSLAQRGNPVADLARAGSDLWLIMSACKAEEKAWEPIPGVFKGELHGVFAMALLRTLGKPAAGNARRKVLTVDEMEEALRERVPQVLAEMKAARDLQTPEFLLPARLKDYPLLCVR